MSCKNARIVVIPSTIEQIEDHAFDHSLIQVIIFEGQYTMWKAMTHDNQDLYVYCSKDSNVVRSISPFEQNSFLHIKKNETLKELLRTKDIDQIKNYCYANMDQRTDEAMISTPYNWDFFYVNEKRLREKLTFPQFHRIPRASTPFILQGRIMLFRGIDIRMPQDISYQIDITGVPVQIGAVGAA